MTNKVLVASALNNYGAMTSKQIANVIYRKQGLMLTPAQVAGALRPLAAKGVAANSKDAYGKAVYWLTDYGKEQLREDKI